MNRRRTGALAAIVLLAVAACSGDDDDESGSSVASGGSTPADVAIVPAEAAAPPDASTLGAVALTTQPVADIQKATAMATRPADGSIYITAQTGQVYRMVPGGPATVVLDLTGTVSEWAPGSERGLLGIEFSPVDGRMFLYYTDLNAQAHLVSYAVGPDGTPDPASVWGVLDIEQPGVGHKGGGINFDSTGTLYLAVGDGGGSRGRDAQDYTKLLGGIARIIPATAGPGYTLPPDNPFVADATKRPEIWAKGLRNPWGFWRDPLNGELWIGDVGEDTVEELNRVPGTQAGANFGWWFIEGTEVRDPGAPPDAVAPIFTYRHDQYGPAIIGGRIYRGAAIPGSRAPTCSPTWPGPSSASGRTTRSRRCR